MLNIKTAIIDNGVNIETISIYMNQIESFKVCDGKVVSAIAPQELTHGTLCAKIFAKQAGKLLDVRADVGTK